MPLKRISSKNLDEGCLSPLLKKPLTIAGQKEIKYGNTVLKVVSSSVGVDLTSLKSEDSNPIYRTCKTIRSSRVTFKPVEINNDLKKSKTNRDRAQTAGTSPPNKIKFENPRSLVKLIPYNNRVNQNTLREFNLKK